MGITMLNSNNKTTDWFDDPGKVLIPQECWGKIKGVADLSNRETQVGRLIFEGQTREEVADALGISTRTVRHHMEILHEKLRVTNRVGLVLRLIQIRDYLGSNP